MAGGGKMKYFSVKDFEKLQHYKDRNPPWIKLYNELLDDYDFACLQDASKLHLIMIFLLASRTNNKIPYDKNWIKNKINATENVDLEGLEKLGFISITEDDSKPLADCKQNACLERERETETDIVKDIDKSISKKPSQNLKPENVSQAVWDDFKKLRKDKKATITQTALNGIIREAEQANITLEAALQECCARGWVGFKAEWYKNSKGYDNGKPKQKHSGFDKQDYTAGLDGFNTQPF
jgi:hypothetical protein